MAAEASGSLLGLVPVVEGSCQLCVAHLGVGPSTFTTATCGFPAAQMPASHLIFPCLLSYPSDSRANRSKPTNASSQFRGGLFYLMGSKDVNPDSLAQRNS